MMTDEELAAELCPDDPAVGLRAVKAMTAIRKASYVNLIDAARALDRHLAGLEPKPAGMILCGPKQIRGAGRG